MRSSAGLSDYLQWSASVFNHSYMMYIWLTKLNTNKCKTVQYETKDTDYHIFALRTLHWLAVRQRICAH